MINNLLNRVKRVLHNRRSSAQLAFFIQAVTRLKSVHKVRNLLGAFTLLCSFHAFSGGVVNSADESSLRSALAGGGTVTFAVDGVIPLASPLIITVDTVVDATGHAITISGNNAVRVFYVNPAVLFTLQHLTVANGRTNTGAGLFNSAGSVTISDCVFTNNQAIGASGSGGQFPGPGESVTGGAVYNSGNLTILNSSFSGNAVAGGPGGSPTGVPEGGGAVGGDGSGGAIYNVGTVALTNTAFTANSAYGGPGGNAAGNSGFFAPGGGGSAFGGAVFSSGGTLSASNCYFGSTVVSAGTAGTVISGRQINYRGTARGGAIFNSGNAALAKVVITNNFAGGSPASGGALHHTNGTLSVSNAVMLNNSVFADRNTTAITSTGSSGFGGALYNGGNATLTDCLVSSNSVTGGAGVVGVGGGSGGGGDAKGGGLYNSGTLDFSRGALAGNSVSGGIGGAGGPQGGGYGGAIMNDGGSVSLVNCTLAVNKAAGPTSPASGYGGGICNNVALTNCTLANNSAGTGGNIAPLGNPSSCVNTIFFAGLPDNTSGGLVDYGHNISSDSSTAFGGQGSLNNTDPRLGPFGNYGGQTPTIPLTLNSVALDAADNSSAPATDQRGRSRPYNSSADIGAFESSPPYVVAGRFFGLNVSDLLIATLDGTVSIDVPSNGAFRYDNLAAGAHSITASNGQWVVAPNPLTLNLGPDVFDANFTAYRWNTVNLASPSNGMAHVVYAGTNGQVHRFLASSNLLTWFTIATNTVLSSNYYEIFDSGSVGQPVRFYRSVSP